MYDYSQPQFRPFEGQCEYVGEGKCRGKNCRKWSSGRWVCSNCCVSFMDQNTTLNPDGYYTFCSNGYVFAAPYARMYLPDVQRYHYTQMGPWSYTGDTCS